LAPSFTSITAPALVLEVEVARERPLGALESELEAALDAQRTDLAGERREVGAQRLPALLAQQPGVVVAEARQPVAGALVELGAEQVVGVGLRQPLAG
jgi:hypothetical protein